jgi:hypothetical protein
MLGIPVAIDRNVRFQAIRHPLAWQPRAASQMKAHRIWLEIVIVGTSIACAVALLIATLGAVAGLAVEALGQDQGTTPKSEQTYEGVVTCSRCGARHSAEIGKSAGECTLVCVHAGERFALVNGDQLHLLEGDLAWLKKTAGERVSVTGQMSGNVIRFSSIKPLSAKTPGL